MLTGALVLLIAGIATFVLHDSFGGYEGLEERLWALVAQLWALVCATVLILEGTLEPDILRAHEGSMRGRAPGRPPPSVSILRSSRGPCRPRGWDVAKEASVPHDVAGIHDGRLLFAYGADETTIRAGADWRSDTPYLIV